MRILAIADQECSALWDFYRPGKLKEYDLILSAGDLKSSYLQFLVTMGRAPLLYIHGNHDTRYEQDPPEGCDCIEDKLVIYRGLRILGLGGSRQYSGGKHQYSDDQMRRRIRRLRRAIWAAGGVDIVLTHGAPLGLGDSDDLAHRGFSAFLELMDQYHPRYLLHGHVHMNYGGVQRSRQWDETQIINCWERYTLDVEPDPDRPKIPLLRRLLIRELEILD